MSTQTSKSTSKWAIAAAVGAVAAGAVAGYKYYTRKQTKSCCGGKKTSQANTKEMEQFPVIDLARFLSNKPEDAAAIAADCKEIARLLHDYGILIVQDPRVREEENETFLNLLERYYEQPESELALDVRADVGYQVGVTPQRIERARDHCERVAQLAPQERPITQCPPELDHKSRFFWRMGELPPKTNFPAMNMPAVIPRNFPEWSTVMNSWGKSMLTAVSTVAEMAALGFDLPQSTFTDLMKYGPHLLAPTASDLKNHGEIGTVFASYHYDLNFLTIHGRSRFPGLYIWTRSGQKMLVRVPPKCLLLQAGKQFEWLTGGEVLAGFHEVVVNDLTLAAVEKAKSEGRSLWRISSTLFGHIASDNILQPLGKFATNSSEQQAKYPATPAGVQVREELQAIKLAAINGMV